MLSFSLQTKVFMAVEPIDMRRSFDSLAAWVDQRLGRKVLDGDVFLFLSTRRDRLKVLWWDGDGYSLFYKSQESEDTHFNIFTRVEIHRTFFGFIDETRSTCF